MKLCNIRRLAIQCEILREMYIPVGINYLSFADEIYALANEIGDHPTSASRDTLRKTAFPSTIRGSMARITAPLSAARPFCR